MILCQAKSHIVYGFTDIKPLLLLLLLLSLLLLLLHEFFTK